MKNNRESKQEHDNKSHLCNFQIRKTLSLSNFKFQIMRLRLKKLVQNFKLLHSTKISNTTQCAGRMVHLTTSSEAPAPLSLLPPLCGEEPLVQIFKLVKPLSTSGTNFQMSKKIHFFRFVAAERVGQVPNKPHNFFLFLTS